MILGLTHIGITAADLNRTLEELQNDFGFRIVSDAERKGEVAERVTGIPGIHTRTVYVSVAPYRHLEVFGFYHPPAVPPEEDVFQRVGISYCALRKQGSLPTLQNAAGRQKGMPVWMTIEKEDPYKGATILMRNADGISLRIITPEAGKAEDKGPGEWEFLYPAILVANMNASIGFYGGVLGLEILKEGRFEPEKGGKKGSKKGFKWVIFKGETGACLKLVQPLGVPIPPAASWMMQKAGFTHIAFGVQNIEGYYSKLIQKNVNFKSSPQAINVGPHTGGKIVYLTTSDGITIEFIDSPLIPQELKLLK